MPPGVGHATVVQAFLEADATWGTRNTTGGTKLEVDSFKLDTQHGVARSKALYGGLSPRALYQMGVKAVGRMAGEVRYEGMAKILAAGLGERPTFAVSATSVDTGIFHIAKTAQVGKPSLSIEALEAGVVKASGDCIIGFGVLIPRLKFTVQGGLDDNAVLKYECDLLAKSKVPQSTAVFTASVPSPPISPVLFHESDSTLFLDGTGDATPNVVSVELEIITPLKDDRLFVSSGSKNIAQPLWNGQAQVIWRVRREFQSYSAWDAANTFADGNLRMIFKSPLTIPTSSPSTPYSIDFESKKCKMTGPPSVDINEWGVIEESVEWEAYHDTTQVGGIDNGPLTITIKQTKDTLVTAGS